MCVCVLVCLRMAKSTKNLSLGPFELMERLLAPTAGAYNDAGSATAATGGDGLPTLDDQLNYFFYDSSLMPLMVQVRVYSHCQRGRERGCG